MVIVHTTSNFNYEIGRNTQTAIEGILSKISLAVQIPTDEIIYKKNLIVGQLTTTSIEVTYLVDYLYPLIKVYLQIIGVSSVYLAVDLNGNFVSYVSDSTQPYGIIVAVTDPLNYFGESAKNNHL